ncbi:hypothetical protein TFLX_04032 [Thermoflexales bacterium]|nr:hypothetical protein TFLX_04032 [Thermoflexales bacterium]
MRDNLPYAVVRKKSILYRCIEVFAFDKSFRIEYKGLSDTIFVNGRYAISDDSLHWFVPRFEFSLEGQHSVVIEVHIWLWFAFKSFILTIDDQIIYSEQSALSGNPLLNLLGKLVGTIAEKATLVGGFLFIGFWFLFVSAFVPGIVFAVLSYLGDLATSSFNLGSEFQNYSHLIAGGLGLLCWIYTLVQIFWRPVSKDSLVRRIYLAEAQAERQSYGIQDPDNEWYKFWSKVQEGDEVWLWSTPAWTWKMLTGREGYVIVRKGKPTRHMIVTGMN